MGRMKKASGICILEGLRSLVGSTSTAIKAANPNPSPISRSSYRSFANLKMTAASDSIFASDRLVSEHGLAKAHLAVLRVKQRRATEQIKLLERKLQQAVTNNAKLKVKHNEDSNLWKGLDSKVSSTKTLCDQLTETVQQLAIQAEQVEEDKKFFEDILGKSCKSLYEFSCLLHDLSTKLECGEQNISGNQDMFLIKQDNEGMDRSYKEQSYSNVEGDKKFFEEVLGKNSNEELNCLLNLCTLCAKQKIVSGIKETLRTKQEGEENDQSVKEHQYSNDDTIIGNCIKKLVKEQASVKSYPEGVHTELRREAERISLLEGKLQQAVNEIAKLKIKKIENSKFWERLDSKISLANTLCDQLFEILHQIASQTEVEASLRVEKHSTEMESKCNENKSKNRQHSK